jgi:hypothetical protein
MKKVTTLFSTLLFACTVYAQVPQKMGYQAVIRDASNQLIVNTPVSMRISILQGSASGTAVMVETHSGLMTNANGLVTVEVGSGNLIIGSIASIYWGVADYWIKTEIDPNNGNIYDIVSTTQLLSVPYALHAANGWNKVNNDLYYDIGNIYVGLITPTALRVNGETRLRAQGSGWNDQLILYSFDWANHWNVLVDDGAGDKLRFAYNDGVVEAMTMLPSGNVGIGTSTPIGRLDVQSSNGVAVRGDCTQNDGWGIQGIATSGSASRAIFGYNPVGYAGYFDGNVHYTGTLTGPSDARLKENISPLHNTLSKVMQLNPRSYNYKSEYSRMNLPKGAQMGFVAQELENVLPQVVHTAYDKSQIDGSIFEYKSVDYVSLIPVLTKAIQEQQSQIEDLKRQIADLKTSK